MNVVITIVKHCIEYHKSWRYNHVIETSEEIFEIHAIDRRTNKRSKQIETDRRIAGDRIQVVSSISNVKSFKRRAILGFKPNRDYSIRSLADKVLFRINREPYSPLIKSIGSPNAS